MAQAPQEPNQIAPGGALAQETYLRSANGAYYAKMQGDGNFVVYVSNHFVPKNALWESGTNGKGSAPYKLCMQKDN
eukprot:CAMPEP_0202719818 /NCGR_PEP_ID=MMETSP1385-20130828/134765_1 /ASSEMBLY_ACC=CAM_ASM_000861 /TAXON_ID=933848 /ORGANISM="Elphidium margaritaceum" /LENGTH=75 /DNA_ID=CAMNT_0049383187 /DNA_START=29 /DNA_END=253 /DNA_ORIENTATION=+